MNWVFDLDTRRLSDATTGSVVASAPLAYPDKYPVSLFLKKSGAPYLLSGSVVYVLKASSRPTSPELASLEIPVTDANEAVGALDLATEELDVFLALSGSTQLTLDLSVLSYGLEVSSLTVPAPTTRRYFVNGAPGPTSSVRTLANQEEAEEGLDNTKWMSPLRTKQAFGALTEMVGIEIM